MGNSFYDTLAYCLYYTTVNRTDNVIASVTS